jgi:hypothetical protein
VAQISVNGGGGGLCTIWTKTLGKINEKLKKIEFLGHFFNV